MKSILTRRRVVWGLLIIAVVFLATTISACPNGRGSFNLTTHGGQHCSWDSTREDKWICADGPSQAELDEVLLTERKCGEYLKWTAVHCQPFPEGTGGEGDDSDDS